MIFGLTKLDMSLQIQKREPSIYGLLTKLDEFKMLHQNTFWQRHEMTHKTYTFIFKRYWTVMKAKQWLVT